MDLSMQLGFHTVLPPGKQKVPPPRNVICCQEQIRSCCP